MLIFFFSLLKKVLTCGTTVSSNNINHGSFVGYDSPDANFLILITEPTQVSFTTCSSNTNFETYLRLYDGCPSEPTTTNLTVEDSTYFCSYLSYNIRSAGTYWLTVIYHTIIHILFHAFMLFFSQHPCFHYVY